MKRLFAIAAIIIAPALAFGASGPVTVFNSAGLAYSTNPAVNLQTFGTPQSAAANVSAQVTWSSAAFSTSTFTDGSLSTATVIVTTMTLALPATDQITVPSTTIIIGAPATAQFTVISTQPLVGNGASFTIQVSTNNQLIVNSTPTVSLAGQFFLAMGVQWSSGTTSNASATNLAAAINADTNGIYTAQVVTSTGVLISCASSSTICNGYVINSTNYPAISTGTMTGGKNPTVLTVNGVPLVANKDWLVVNSLTTTGSNLAAALNANLPTVIASTNVAGVVFSTAIANGTAGNSYTTATSLPASLSTTTFSGGLGRGLLNASLTINGVVYENGGKWNDQSNTSTGTQVSIASFMNTLGVIIASTGNASVIYASATVAGSAGNLFTVAASTTNFTIASANFKNGQDATSLTVNGQTFTAGVSFSTGTTGVDATNLATAITNSSGAIHVVAHSVNQTVFATSTISGILTNYPLITNNTNYLTLSSSTFLGGTSAGYAPGSGIISAPAHGFTTGLEVILSTGNATIAPLTDHTLYYVVVIDSNDVALSTTSALAQTGNYVTITSSAAPTATAHALTLGPMSYIGNAGGFWQVSNDGSNWAQLGYTLNNVAVSTQGFVSVFPSSTSLQDLGRVDQGYMRYNITGPTQGGVAVKVILNAKD